MPVSAWATTVFPEHRLLAEAKLQAADGDNAGNVGSTTTNKSMLVNQRKKRGHGDKKAQRLRRRAKQQLAPEGEELDE